MFDIGWTELLVVGVVALIVVGPKDLPKMFRALGQFTAKARNMAREFQRAMDAAADETGVKDVAQDLRKATSARNMGLDDLDDLARGGKRSPPGKPARAGSRKPALAATGDAAADPEGEAAADAELDTVAREMEKLRAERAAQRAQARPATAPGTDPAPGDSGSADNAPASSGSAAAPRSEGPAS